MGHIVLLGDSIFDNAAYVNPGEDVTSLLKAALPAGWGATLRAVDGACLQNVGPQLVSLPEDTTHLAFSCGGNDALGYLGVLSRSAGTIGEALAELNQVRVGFWEEYYETLRSIVDLGLPVIACSIYDPQFDEDLQGSAEAALCLFNDGITRAMFRLGTSLLDLRCLFDAPEDMANPIEPSVIGGGKIAAALGAWCTGRPGPVSTAVSYTHLRAHET